MTDYKSMYYHLAGRMATTIEVLEATTEVLEATTKTMEATSTALVTLKEKLKLAQQVTENMFIKTYDHDLSEILKEQEK